MDLPVEKLEELCEALCDYKYTIHSKNEDEYSYLQEGDVCISLTNEAGQEDVFIDLNDEITLTFGDFHDHYGCDDEGYSAMLSDLTGYLRGESCSVSAFSFEEEKAEWLMTTVISSSECTGDSSPKSLESIGLAGELLRRIERGGGEIHFDFWDVSKSYIIKVGKDGEKA